MVRLSMTFLLLTYWCLGAYVSSAEYVGLGSQDRPTPSFSSRPADNWTKVMLPPVEKGPGRMINVPLLQACAKTMVIPGQSRSRLERDNTSFVYSELLLKDFRPSWNKPG